MKKLALPLYCYDDAGRILPSTWFNLIHFWGARTLILLALNLALGEGDKTIFSRVLPTPILLKLYLLLSAGYIVLWLAQGRRQWFWQRGYSMAWIKPLLLLFLVVDVLLQLLVIAMHVHQFDALIGVILLITLFALSYVLRSKRTRLMYADWRASA